MAKVGDKRKVWLVKFPTHQYVEDVKEIAQKNNLRVIDSRFRTHFNMDFVESSPPKLTLKPKAKAKAE